ncbi:MAG: argininosuccinate lyase [Tissierellales bacterium]|jgi:argininosuccinate lyase|nr:argininosuccinate lyase [Tissierellales bacterium]MBN2827598.1 argininosuccinate lyase [Tissierellales bacterium]
MANLWSGRFEKSMDKLMEEFNASIDLDKRYYNVDIDGSIAHVTMLGEQGVVSHDEAQIIREGLEKIRLMIEHDEVEFSSRLEDIHMTIETLLINEVGDVGKKLHTGRSRNDQVALDTRLFMIRELHDLMLEIKTLMRVILNKAEAYKSDIMIGFTHMQHAQPITVGFHMMAYFQMFKRDLERIEDCIKRLDYNPLGSGALAGTTININRHRTTELLGFSHITENAMDAVSDKDFVIEFISDASICMMHLSRFSEEFIIWNSQEFSYIDIDDAYCTGSSIMPQKKNPDIAELIRGKTGRVYGDLIAMLTIMKGTPLAYNKDFQEDKSALFDALDTLKTCIVIFAKMLENTKFQTEEINQHINKGFLAATDIAEHMVKLGIPFRQAHEMVGSMVKYCEKNRIRLEDLNEADYGKISSSLTREMIPDLSALACVERRISYGGTSIQDVERQIKVGREYLR